MLSIEIETYKSLPCRTKAFRVNGIDADINDFGETDDTGRCNVTECGCGCMEFVSNNSKMNDAMQRYNVSEDEFHEVQKRLELSLCVGECSLCL